MLSLYLLSLAYVCVSRHFVLRRESARYSAWITGNLQIVSTSSRRDLGRDYFFDQSGLIHSKFSRAKASFLKYWA